MLASTIQISNNNPTPTPPCQPAGPDGPGTKQPHPTTPPAHQPATNPATGPTDQPATGMDMGLIPQNPNSVPPPNRTQTPAQLSPRTAPVPGPGLPGGEMSMIPL